MENGTPVIVIDKITNDSEIVTTPVLGSLYKGQKVINESGDIPTLYISDSDAGVSDSKVFPVGNSSAFHQVAVSTTLTYIHGTVECSGAITITLPSSIGIAGRNYTVKNIDDAMVTIQADGIETIDGYNTKQLLKNDSITLQSNGSNWNIIWHYLPTTYADYALTQTGNTPTTFTKLDLNGAVLINKTQDLFDVANSRILKMPLNSVGKAVVNMGIDTTTGTGHYIDLQLRGFNNIGTLLFTKRTSTVSLVKNNTSDGVHKELEFYFGLGVEYFEVWYRTNLALPYTDPAITILRL